MISSSKRANYEKLEDTDVDLEKIYLHGFTSDHVSPNISLTKYLRSMTPVGLCLCSCFTILIVIGLVDLGVILCWSWKNLNTRGFGRFSSNIAWSKS